MRKNCLNMTISSENSSRLLVLQADLEAGRCGVPPTDPHPHQHLSLPGSWTCHESERNRAQNSFTKVLVLAPHSLPLLPRSSPPSFPLYMYKYTHDIYIYIRIKLRHFRTGIVCMPASYSRAFWQRRKCAEILGVPSRSAPPLQRPGAAKPQQTKKKTREQLQKLQIHR